MYRYDPNGSPIYSAVTESTHISVVQSYVMMRRRVDDGKIMVYFDSSGLQSCGFEHESKQLRFAFHQRSDFVLLKENCCYRIWGIVTE